MIKKEIETIPYESLINITVSGAFYSRLQDMLFSICSEKPKDEYLEALKNISSNNIQTSFEYNLSTLLILITEIENKAKEQSMVKMQEIELPQDDKKD